MKMSDEEREQRRAARVQMTKLISESSIGGRPLDKQQVSDLRSLLVDMTPNDPWVIIKGQPYFKYEYGGIPTWVTLFPDEHGSPYFKMFHDEYELTGED